MADKKHVAYCDPPQAENLAGEILFYRIQVSKIDHERNKRMIYER